MITIIIIIIIFLHGLGRLTCSGMTLCHHFLAMTSYMM
jgi:hypothetical protein